MNNLRAFVAGTAAVLLALFGQPAQTQPATNHGGLSILGELAPSIASADFDAKARFTRRAMQAAPMGELAIALGFDPDELRWSYGSGGYRESISPNLVVRVTGTSHERACALALGWMYVYRQEAVPVVAVAPVGEAAVRIELAHELTPALEQGMFAELQRAFGRDAGYTRTGGREILVIDFDRSPGFAAGIEAFTLAMTRLNAVVRTERYAVKAEYRMHDWRAEPDGSRLLEEIMRIQPRSGLAERLRHLRARYEAELARWRAAPDDPGRPAAEFVY